MELGTILWDLDMTLLDFDRSEVYAITKCFDDYGIPKTEGFLELYHEINDSYWKRLELGEISKEQVLRGRFESLFEALGIHNVDIEAFRQDYQRELGSVAYYLDNSYEICKSLKGRVRQYVVTNGVYKTQESKMKLSGFDRIMDGVFVSEKIGYPKPQPAFFEACFAEIPGFSKEKTMIIGDSLSSDIKGGSLSGIHTCWYNPKHVPLPEGAVQPEYEISSLRQVLSFLEK